VDLLLTDESIFSSRPLEDSFEPLSRKEEFFSFPGVAGMKKVFRPGGEQLIYRPQLGGYRYLSLTPVLLRVSRPASGRA
jgi:hypothetical protein